MSAMRRRVLGGLQHAAPNTSSAIGNEPVSVIPTAHLKKLTRTKSKRRQTAIFILGGLFGILVAVFFAQRHDVINLEGLADFNLNSLIDVIPAGIVREATDLTVSHTKSNRGSLILTQADRCLDLETRARGSQL